MKRIGVLRILSIATVFSWFTGVMAQPTQDASSYFPLHIGNQWSYSSPTDTITLKILDTARIHGRLYYHMSNGDTSIPSLYWTWYRCLNDTVFVLVMHYDSTESHLYYLNASVGDTLPMNPDYGCLYGSSSILSGKEDTVTTPPAIYFRCYHFTYGKNCFDAGMWDSWLAQGIGVVRFRRDNLAGARTYTLQSSVILTSVNQPKDDAAVSSYLLLECYPNPFNPQTTLTFHVNEGSHVTLTIFDLLGRKIDEVVNEFRSIGTYQVSWNAKDISSGTYFAVLKTNNSSITKRLVLQK